MEANVIKPRCECSDAGPMTLSHGAHGHARYCYNDAEVTVSLNDGTEEETKWVAVQMCRSCADYHTESRQKAGA